jgi:pimeloyl-ACP methyl ester carboxylesterase
MEQRIMQVHGYGVALLVRESEDIPIVCLHGLTCTKESFLPIFESELFDAHTLIAIDLLGHGESSKPKDFSYTMEDHAAIVLKVLEALGIEEHILLGHSMGGAIGLLVSEQKKPLQLISVEGNLVAKDCGVISRKTISSELDAFMHIEYKKLIDKFRTYETDGMRQWLKMVVQADPYAWYHSAFSLVEWCDSERLVDIWKRLTGKAYIYGEKSDHPALSSLEIEPLCVQKAGHFVMLDNPEGFCNALTRTLKS